MADLERLHAITEGLARDFSDPNPQDTPTNGTSTVYEGIVRLKRRKRIPKIIKPYIRESIDKLD